MSAMKLARGGLSAHLDILLTLSLIATGSCRQHRSGKSLWFVRVRIVNRGPSLNKIHYVCVNIDAL